MKTDSIFPAVYARARNGGRTPARLAIETARRHMAAIATARAAYLESNPATGNAEAPGALPIDHGDGHKARAAYVDAIARAGGYGSGRVWGPCYRDGDGDGLREVGDVGPGGYRGAEWNNGARATGYYCNPWGESWGSDGDGLAWGVVYQLPARRGVARFVAGVQFGGVDGGPSLDFATVYESDSEESARDGARESGAMAAADSMAEAAAEKESAYQAAWRAGSDYAEAAEAVAEARRNALALLKERRAAMGQAGGNAPAICRAIADSVSAWRADMAEARATMAEAVESIWGPDHESAFIEGAGLDAMPTGGRA